MSLPEPTRDGRFCEGGFMLHRGVGGGAARARHTLEPPFNVVLVGGTDDLLIFMLRS